MKNLIVMAVFFFIPCIGHALEVVGVKGSDVIIENEGRSSFQITRYITESKYCGRNTTRGTIFWKREQLSFEGTGRYSIPMDISKAKSGESYCITIVNNTMGSKVRFYVKIINGRFVR